MKIAIPLDENKQDVCIVLSRAPYFLFHEDNEDTITENIAENPAAQAQGGAGIQAAQFLVDNGVNVLITVRCGQNAADVFKAADMKIYQSANKAAADDLTAWKEGKLSELTKFHGGFHGVQ
ncbi:MAG: NifB/NifX family molybdenum-iron cluster-binding protein [Lachnospiraceae bacterium]|nr:NifB/NifX family molybdenum-iron cluster-binding protein [Lachnospiraceae bacterium]MDY4970972.1 NifB/NifX family molybdenum-iron cluster-binding protein [Lachnospiraceae bacterium]